MESYINKLPKSIRVNPDGRELTEGEQDKMQFHFSDYSWSNSLCDNRIYFGPLDVDENEEGFEAWGYITVEQLEKLKITVKKQERSSNLTELKWYKKLMNKIK